MIIWLASYPRSGNTLLRTLLRKVFGQTTYSRYDDVRDIGSDARLADEVGHQFLPQEWQKAQLAFESDKTVRFVKTHEPPEGDGKAIYIVRDGRASIVSYWHYLKDFADMDAQTTLQKIILGFVPYGSWGGHLDAWNPLQRPQTLLLRFEDLVSDPEDSIGKIAEFCAMAPRDAWTNKFDDLHQLAPRFFRRGQVGSYVGEYSTDELAAFQLLHGDWSRLLGYEPELRKEPDRANLRAQLTHVAAASRNTEEALARQTVVHKSDMKARLQVIDEQGRQLGTLETIRRDLEAQVADLRRRVQETAAERDAQTQTAEKLRQQLGDSESDRAARLQVIEEQGRQLGTMETIRRDLEAQVADLRRRVQETAAELDRQVDVTNEQSKVLGALEALCRHLIEQVAKINHERETGANGPGVQRRQIQWYETNIAELDDLASGMRRELDCLTETLKNTEDVLATLRHRRALKALVWARVIPRF